MSRLIHPGKNISIKTKHKYKYLAKNIKRSKLTLREYKIYPNSKLTMGVRRKQYLLGHYQYCTGYLKVKLPPDE